MTSAAREIAAILIRPATHAEIPAQALIAASARTLSRGLPFHAAPGDRAGEAIDHPCGGAIVPLHPPSRRVLLQK